ncbi:MAG: hypothetical protein JXQ99_06605 [Hyphomicrobiaceae bacterium]
MFDFGQIIEKVSGLFEQGGASDALGSNLTDLVEAANFDPSILANAPIDQLSELLNQAGIDPTKLADGEILDTAQDLLQSGTLDHIDLGQLQSLGNRQQ